MRRDFASNSEVHLWLYETPMERSAPEEGGRVRKDVALSSGVSEEREEEISRVQ